MTLSSLTALPADASPARVFRAGFATAWGTPLLIMGASFLGYGALCRETGLTPGMVMLASLGTWALPGQIITVEMIGIDASLIAIGIAVALVNLRLLPMVVALMPHLAEPQRPGWQRFGSSHLIAVTSWVHTMQAVPLLAPPVRIFFLWGIALALMLGSTITTMAGYYAGGLPPLVVITLIFINPVYFLLVFMTGRVDPALWLALAGGLVLGPLASLVSPDWALLLGGLGAGSLAFAAERLGLGRR